MSDVPLDLAATTVVIESPATDRGPTDRVVAACESVLGPGRCVQGPWPGAVANALVYRVQLDWLDPAHVTAQIRVSQDRSAAEPEPHVRTVTFSAQDTIQQREHAAGIVIAARVVSTALARPYDGRRPQTESVQLPAATPHQPNQPETARDQPPTQPLASTPAQERAYRTREDRRHGWTWGIDAGALTGNGLNWRHPEFGLELRTWARPRSAPWRGYLGATLAESSDTPRVASRRLSLGLAAHLDTPNWLEPRIGLHLASVEIEGTSSEPRRVDRARLLRTGLHFGCDFRWTLGSWVALLGSLEISASLPTYDVWVAGQHAGAAGLLGGRALIGLRIGLD